MVAESIAQRFDNTWPVFTACPLKRLMHDLHNRDCIVTVDTIAVNPGGKRFVRNSFSRGLLFQRHRNRPAVIVHDEYHRQCKSTGYIDRFIKIAFRRGTVTAGGDYRALLIAILNRVGNADGVAGLRRYRNVDRKILRLMPVMHAPLIAAPVTQNFLEQHTALYLCGDITIIGNQHIVAAHCETNAGTNGLLALARRVSAEFTGTLQVDCGPIEQPCQQHDFVKLAK